jgi:hypothetical protein
MAAEPMAAKWMAAKWMAAKWMAAKWMAAGGGGGQWCGAWPMAAEPMTATQVLRAARPRPLTVGASHQSCGFACQQDDSSFVRAFPDELTTRTTSGSEATAKSRSKTVH